MPPFDFEPETWFRVIDVAAIVTNGLLGGAVVRAHRFDIVGFIIFSVITAMGGGIIRDVLLDTGFPVALTDSYYWVAALGSAALAYLMDFGSRWADRTLLVADFLGMGCWTATGTIKALALGLHWLPAIALGVVTAVGGGALRDIMVNRIPAILGGSPLYATVAFVGASEVALCVVLWDQQVLGMALSIVTCLVMGILARWRRWQLPEPVDIRLRVPRPRLLAKRKPRLVAAQAWQPGNPITQEMRIVDAQKKDYRQMRGFLRNARGTIAPGRKPRISVRWEPLDAVVRHLKDLQESGDTLIGRLKEGLRRTVIEHLPAVQKDVRSLLFCID